MKNKLGLRPNLFVHGEIKIEHPTFFAAKIKVVKTFMASNLLFVLENKSWGYKSNPKQIPKSCGPRQSQDKTRYWGGGPLRLVICFSLRVLNNLLYVTVFLFSDIVTDRLSNSLQYL